MSDGFIFQQDGAPAHRACNARLVTYGVIFGHAVTV